MRKFLLLAVMVLSLLLGLIPALSVGASSDYDSLLQEIEAANLSGMGSITLAADIELSAALPPITGDLEIDGDGYSIGGANEFRIFDVDGGKLTIADMTLTEGSSPEDGGAILLRNDGALAVENVAFTDNASEKGGGAISTSRSNVRLEVSNSVFEGNAARSGGGAILVNGGRADISGSSFQDNFAGRFGGGVEAFIGRVEISNSTFVGNEASEGGGILVSGAQTTLTHLTIVDNIARESGDGIFKREGSLRLYNSIVTGGSDAPDCKGGNDGSLGNFSQDGACSQYMGGDPLLAELTGSPGYFPLLDGSPAVDAADMAHCLETDQTGKARPIGGGCDIGAFESEAAAPAAATPTPEVCTLSDHILSANSNTAVGACPAGTSHDIISLSEDITLDAPLPQINGTITIEGNGFTISGNHQFRIFTIVGRTLTIKDLTLADGYSPEDGGAILVENGAALVVENAAFEDNRTEKGGGAISTGSPGDRLSVSNSLFRDNFANSGGGAILLNGGRAEISGSAFLENEAGRFGGAIEAFKGQADISNSTFSGNQAGQAGGILVSGARTTMTHLTLKDNLALWDEGDEIARREGRAILRNSIVDGGGEATDCSGGLDESRGNLSRDGSCAASLSGDPLLGGLTGEPAHFPLQEGSPALDAADRAYCLETDQIGAARPQGAGCDIGAIEYASEMTSADQAQTAADETGEQAFSDCSVTTTDVLNFRDAPAGDWIGNVPANTTLAAMARTSAWFKVTYNGDTGWISAGYVTMAGACG